MPTSGTRLSTEQLAAGGQISLVDGSMLTIGEVLRVLPGRRVVCFAEWCGQSVLAKIFLGKKAAYYAQRDAVGVQLLMQAEIATPALLTVIQSYNGEAEVLLFAAILNSSNAEIVWSGLDDSSQLQLAKALVHMVARHHNAGLMQTDLYLKNFLLHEGELYTLDGDGIRKLPSTGVTSACWRNLALLLSKFDICDEPRWLPELLGVYADARGCKPISLQELTALVTSHRHRVVDGYADHKVFRNCTDVAVTRTWLHYIARVRDALTAWPDMAVLDELLDSPSRARLKSGNTCTVGLVVIEGRKIVVKRYNIKSWLHGLSRLWRRSRAALSWANAHRLRMHGIATAAPVALVERRFGPLRLTAYFLAEYVDAPDIGVCMADRAVSQDEKREVADRLAKLMYKLRLLQIAHGDMKATNIHVAAGVPVLIDLDSMRHYRCGTWFERRHGRDLQRLLRNWADRPHIQRLMVEALRQVYGNDPILKKAGI